MYSIRKSGMMIEIGEYSWRHCGDATRMKYCETPQDIQDLLMRMSPVEIAAAIHALFVAKSCCLGGLREGSKRLGGLRAGKRQSWTPWKTDGRGM